MNIRHMLMSKPEPAVVATLNYIADLANEVGCDISGWDITDVFKGDSTGGLTHSRAEINKLFFAKHRGEPIRRPTLDPEVMKKAEQALKTVLQERRRQIDANIRDCMNSISEYHDEIEARTAQLKAYFEQHKNCDAGYMDKIAKICEDGFYLFDGLHIRPGTTSERNLVFLTRPVQLNYRRRDGVEFRLPMGEYKVFWNPLTNAIRCYPHKNNLICGGHCSPFINGSGAICWGESANSVQKIIAEGNIPEVLNFLRSLLTEFAEGANPYVAIETFEASGTINGKPWKEFIAGEIRGEMQNGQEKEEEVAELQRAAGAEEYDDLDRDEEGDADEDAENE